MVKQSLLLQVAACVTFLMFGCSAEQGREKSGPKPTVHGGTGTEANSAEFDEGLVSVVMKQKVSATDSRTIGNAFSTYRYFSDREWKETRNASGRTYVDFRGFLPDSIRADEGKAGLIRRGVEIKFVIDEKGKLYVAMVSRVDVMKNGTSSIYPIKEGKAIVDNIFSNKHITF